MALQLFTNKTAWDKCRRATRHSASALSATEEHADLAKPIRDMLIQWKAIEAERVDAEDALVDVNALIRRLDAMLDREVNQLVVQLLAENNRDMKAAGFRIYFPEPPNEVIRLGLESEIERTKKFNVVASEVGASDKVKEILQRIEAIRVKGAAAIKAREKVAETAGRVSLRISVWKDDANHARRSLESALDQYATDHRLPRGYADEFFPARDASKKGKGDDDEGGGSGAGGGSGTGGGG